MECRRTADAKQDGGFRVLPEPDLCDHQGQAPYMAVGARHLLRHGSSGAHRRHDARQRRIEGDTLVVEHYDYQDSLIRVIEGRDARNNYLTLIRNGWVSTLDQAAYAGKELAKAQRSMEHGIPFVQDGA
jgi:hypothetical protein